MSSNKELVAKTIELLDRYEQVIKEIEAYNYSVSFNKFNANVNKITSLIKQRDLLRNKIERKIKQL